MDRYLRLRLEEIAGELVKRHDEAEARFIEIQKLGTFERESQFCNLIGRLEGSLINAQIEIQSLIPRNRREEALPSPTSIDSPGAIA